MNILLGVVCAIVLCSRADCLKASVPENTETATIYVDAGRGSDSNPGTDAKPLSTLSKAARIAVENNRKGIGSRVIINPGTYRESVELVHTGRETSAPITFQAAQTGTAIVSGSDIWTGWQASPQNPRILTHRWPYGWGLCAVPKQWPCPCQGAPTAGCNPELAYTCLKNIVRRREMIFVNGDPLTQVLSLVQLREGAFFVDEPKSVVYIWPPAGIDSSAATIEVATRPHLFTAHGKVNLSVRGLTFQHANTCMEEELAVGFVSADGKMSDNILVEDSTFQWNNWAGFGFNTASNVILRRSRALHNGSAGMSSYLVKNALFEDDEGSFNNWRGAMGGFNLWDAAGGKFLRMHGAAFRNWKAVANRTVGLWFDTDNVNVTVDGANLSDNQLDGLFIEISRGPILVENSHICNNAAGDQSHGGVLGSSSPNVVLTGNVIANNGGPQIVITGDIGGSDQQDWETGQHHTLFVEKWTLTHNSVVGSNSTLVGIGTPSWQTMPKMNWQKFFSTLFSDNNLWYNPTTRFFFQYPRFNEFIRTDLAGWRAATHQDQSSVYAPLPLDLPSECRPSGPQRNLSR